MAQEISDLNIRKTHNKQYMLPNTPSEQDDRSQDPIMSDHITCQDGKEAEKCIHQSCRAQINESNYLLPNTPKYDTNKDNEAGTGPRQDQEKDSITTFRTIHSKFAHMGHFTKLPRQRNITPTANAKDYVDIIDDIGPEDSASQISITHLP